MTAVAKVKVLKGRKTPNGNEAIYSLRMGESGTGKEIGRATFWPWSAGRVAWLQSRLARRIADEWDRVTGARPAAVVVKGE